MYIEQQSDSGSTSALLHGTLSDHFNFHANRISARDGWKKARDGIPLRTKLRLVGIPIESNAEYSFAGTPVVSS